jgi:predicted ferric reductase
VRTAWSDRVWQVASWIAGIVVCANAVVIVMLWLAGGGISAVHNAAEFWTSVGRITGLLGAYLLLIQVLLLARLPFVERFRSFDRLTVWHRRNGKLCLYLIVAHVVFITVGYAMSDRVTIVKEAQNLWTLYPGMVTATFGTLMLIAVTVTSLVIVRRGLRYEAWYLVHLLAYAGILLAWFHQLPTGNEFVTNAPAAAYWTALYLVTLGLVVLFRLAAPIVRGALHDLRVTEVVEEVPGIVSLRIAGRRIDRFHARAGQFFLWRFFARGVWWESHPFSLSAAPDSESFRITVKALGDFSQNVGAIRPGTRVLAEGPFGHFTEAARHASKVLLIAGGIGITPIRALAEEMDGDIVIVYRVIKHEDVVFRAELDRLSEERGVRVQYVVGHHAAPGGERLMSPEHLRELVPDLAERDIYVCGPPRMADFIVQNVRAAGIAAKRIHLERFAL